MTALSSLRAARRIAAAILAFGAILGAAAPAAAQDSTRIVAPGGLPCSYDSCALRVEDGWFSRRLVRGPNGVLVAKLGIGGPKVTEIVQLSDSAVAHARSYQHAQTVGNTFTLLGTISSVAAIVALNQRKGDQRSESIAVNVGTLVLYGIGTAYNLKARRELSRSLWWYNRAVLGEGR